MIDDDASATGSEGPDSSQPSDDYGLPGLGLMMQLWAGLEALMLVTVLIFTLRISVAGVGMALLMLGMGIVRALSHFIAGLEVRAGGMNVGSRVIAFLVISVVYVGLWKWQIETELGLVVTFVLGALLLWPAFLVVVFHLPAWRERFRLVREGELELRGPDRGIEGVGAIMTVLGLAAVVLAGAAAIAFNADGSLLHLPKYGTWLAISAAAIVVRGAVHAFVGIRALAGCGPTRFRELVTLYVRVHWGTALVAASPLLYGIYEGVDLMGTASFAVLSMLSVWPMLLRGFARDAAGEFDLEDEEVTAAPARAPDGGLRTLGWFLCALALSSLVSAVLPLIENRLRLNVPGMMPGGSWYSFADLPVWTGPLGVAVAMWAGLELVAMTARARIAAIGFAVVTLGIMLWGRLDALTSIGKGMDRALMQTAVVFQQADVLVAFIVPGLALALALRPRPDAPR